MIHAPAAAERNIKNVVVNEHMNFCKKFSTLVIFFFLIFIFSSFAISAERTVVTIIEGEVLCFDIPEELVPTIRPGEIIIGIFIEKKSDYRTIVEIMGKRVSVYVPYNQRYSVYDKLYSGANILLQKNLRRIYQTEWDIISVGEIAIQGSIYSKGVMQPAETEQVIKLAQTAEEVKQEVRSEEKTVTTEVKSEVTTEALKEKGVTVEAVTKPTEAEVVTKKETAVTKEEAPAAAKEEAPVVGEVATTTATTTTSTVTAPAITTPPAEEKTEWTPPEESTPAPEPAPEPTPEPTPTPSAPTIDTTSSLSAGTEGTAYSQTLSASSGSSPYTWTLTSGSLPSGLSLSSSGIISGTPNTGSAGSYTFTIKVTDSASQSSSKEFTLTINPAALTISTSSLSNGAENTTYSQTLSATGGTSPYTWSLVSGSLPSGLSLTTAGVISGTPGNDTASSTPYSFTVRVTDSASRTADKELSIKISGYITADWTQANTSGFGSTNNRTAASITTFNSYIYVGTYNFTNGGEIWRSSNGTTWTQANTSGFGSVNNSTVNAMTTFSSYVYAGVHNTVTGVQIWRSSDGTTWTQANTSGFGNVQTNFFYSWAVFNNYLYAGTWNSTTGGQIWRSQDGTTWTQANTSGFGSGDNDAIYSMAVLGDYLYAATTNSVTGGQIWRSSDGTTWTQVNTSGFGSTDNSTIYSMMAFGDYIYAGTTNTTSGGQIWRSSDGTTWTQVNTSGFGDTNNRTIWNITEFGNYIYAGTQNPTTGGEIWRSSDGTNWTQSNTDGFGDSANRGAYTMSSLGSYLYAGTGNTTTGCQVWRYYELYVDPNITGRVYDSVTGDTISSPTISIYPKDSTTALVSTTANPYAFNVSDGYYYFRIEKEGYTFPSNKLNGITPGDHGENFYASGTSMSINIPIDQGYPLEIVKTANKRRIVNGDIITFDIKIRNRSMWALSNINIIDEITNGFKYVVESTYVDNTQLSDSNISIDNHIGTFKLTSVPGYKETHLTYQVRVGSGISAGEYKTKAKAWDRARDWRMSNDSSFSIQVIYDAMFTLGTIIGKVFNDTNGNGVQDKDEKGIAKVKIATEYGVIVETDRDGKYHIPAVPPGTHLLKIDPSTLSEGAKITTENPYLVKITEGLLAKVNFGVTKGNKRKPHGTSGNFFIVALGEGIVRNLSTSGNIDMVNQDDRYDKGLNLDGKIALYLKGKIKGKYLVIMSVDTDRRPGKRGKAYQMQKLFTNLDPDKYYPVYGDASKIDYEANDTQDELYLLIEWDESYIKYGVFNTAIPLYNRTLQGANIIYQSVKKTKFGDPYTKINAFYARAYQVAAHDEFIGTGGSLYYIRHTPVIEGSEKVRVELRDEVSKEAIGTAILTEERDYEIDYDTGRIILKKPLSSVNYNYSASIISNDILSGARAYLIIDYEYESTSTIRRESYGIKASQQLGNHIRVGGTYVEEQKENNYYRLMGGDSAIKFNQDTEISGEYNRSENTQLSGAYSIDGGLSYDVLSDTANDTKTGSSVAVRGKTKLFDNTDINLGYTRQDDNYSATNTISTQGTDIYTGSILSRLKENLLMGIRHITQEVKDATLATDLIGNNKVHTTTALLDYLPNRWDIRMEYQHQTVDNPFIDFTYAGYRQLMNHDIIGGRVGYKITQKIHPYIGGQVTVQNFVNNQGYAGLEYEIWDSTYIRLKETAGNLGNSTLIGLTSQTKPSTEAYTNVEIGNNAQLGGDGKFTRITYGQRTQIDKNSSISWQKDYSSYQQNILQGELVGYETKLTDALSIGTSYERSFIEKEPTAISRDSGSVTLSYLNIDKLKVFSKLEVREDRGGTDRKRQWLTENNILYQMNQDISLLGRGNWSTTDNRSTHNTDAQFHEMGVGLAYRPVEFDRLNLLGKYSYITNDSPESQNDFIQTTQGIRNIYAIEGAYDILKYLQLVGKFTMRDMREKVGPRGWTNSQAYLYIGRLNFHVTNKWDIAAEYRTLANKQIEDKKSGWLLEVDREIAKYIRLGAGYNFTDYDDDLSNSDNYNAKGWFVRVNGKY